jgi:hypothetical protein
VRNESHCALVLGELFSAYLRGCSSACATTLCTQWHLTHAGSNVNGRLGDGSTTESTVPVPVVGGGTWIALDAGGYESSCGIANDGTALCWGECSRSVKFELFRYFCSRNGSTFMNNLCVCVAPAGANAYGQLGDGTTADKGSPTPVLGEGKWGRNPSSIVPPSVAPPPPAASQSSSGAVPTILGPLLALFLHEDLKQSWLPDLYNSAVPSSRHLSCAEYYPTTPLQARLAGSGLLLV